MSTESIKDPFHFVIQAMESERAMVIPIIGGGLLQVEQSGKLKPYYRLLAERLVCDLPVDQGQLTAEPDLNDVVWAQPGFRGDTTLERETIRQLIHEPIPIPQSLETLAAIKSFRFFVSTTVDPLLEKAISAVRKRKPAVITFPPDSSLTDFSDALLDSQDTVIFQMLGRCSTSEFAITEGQVLEHLHRFLTAPNRPQEILHLLNSSHLLFLGADFPTWLSQFLLRSMRPKALWDWRFIKELLPLPPNRSTGVSPIFVHKENPRYSKRFPDHSPAEFLEELGRRWRARPANQPQGQDADIPAHRAPPPDSLQGKIPEGMVFLSYASEDRPRARRFQQALLGCGIDVWMDETGLESGDEFASKIEDLIQHSSAFVPLLSHTTNQEEPRWFRKEWKWAVDRSEEFTGTQRKFLFPVLLDPLRPESITFLEFRKHNIDKAADDGSPPPNLITQLREVQRNSRRARP